MYLCRSGFLLFVVLFFVVAVVVCIGCILIPGCLCGAIILKTVKKDIKKRRGKGNLLHFSEQPKVNKNTESKAEELS